MTRGIIGLLVTLVLGPVVVLLTAEGQQTATIARIGFLSPASPALEMRRLEAFWQRLRELGYVEGHHLALESRYAEGQYDRLPGLAAELVRLKVDIILTYAQPAIQAAQQATGTIPIVMTGNIDPVASGFVASLARPGGNITGLSLMAPELVTKQLEILKEVVPTVTRVALLGNPVNAGNAPQLRYAQDTARTLGLRLQPLDVRGPQDLDRAFAAMTTERAEAVIVLVDAMLLDYRTRIAHLAATYRLPAVYGLSDHAAAGGLMAYGASVLDRYRRAATYVDKILKGTKPADLPVEQPTTFELVINLKTAKDLGLTIPPTLLFQADEVIR
jgi:putative tryptophan/tyrosine transport system substrate-binding protein